MSQQKIAPGPEEVYEALRAIMSRGPAKDVDVARQILRDRGLPADGDPRDTVSLEDMERALRVLHAEGRAVSVMAGMPPTGHWRSPEYVNAEAMKKRRAEAEEEALSDLAVRHPEEFQALVDEHMRRLADDEG